VAKPGHAQAIIDRLKLVYPDAHCELDHKTPLQLLMATILSAQCTDVRVNMVTPELFRKYPDAAALASAKQEELEEIIRTTGFFRNKAKSLIGAAATLVQKYGGQVPQTMDELTALPGVGRKTANVVLGNCFGNPEGVVVDTHVKRLSNRLGFTKETDPEKIEADITPQLRREDWAMASHLLIFHGRRCCYARNPECARCSIADACPADSSGRYAGPAAKSKSAKHQHS
jgi:endonuclease-3